MVPLGLFLLLHDKMPQKIIGRLKNNLALILILIFYLGLASYHFFAQGLVNWDEAYFMATVNTFSEVIKTAAAHPIGLFTDHSLFNNLLAGYNNAYTAARPSYILPAVAINLIFASEHSTRLLSILSGFLALIFFYRLLGFFNLSRRVKIASVFLLAASPLFLIYSRLGLSQIFSAAFFLISAYYLIRFNEEKKTFDLKIAALALAVFMMSHYNTLVITGLLLASALYFLYQSRQGWKKYATLIIYFLFLPMVWELITRIGAMIANSKGVLNSTNKAVILSYFNELTQQYSKAGSGNGFSFEQFFYYGKILYSTEGIVFSFLFCLGLIFAIKNFRKIKYSFLLIFPLIYLAIFSLVPLKFPRNILTVLPGLYLFCALGLASLAKPLAAHLKNNFKMVILAAFCLTIVLANASQYSAILNVKTGFKDITSFIKADYPAGQTAVFSNAAPIWRAYLPGYQAETPTKMYEWMKNNPNKKAIFIEDYFTTIKGGFIPEKGFSASIVKQTPTNIFSVKPIVLDFIYQDEPRNQKMFTQGKNAQISVLEISSK